MNKNIKRLLFTLLAAVTAFASVSVAACTEDFGNPETDGYEATFLYPDGSPVKGTDYAGNGQKAPKTYAVLQDGNGNNLTQPATGILNDYGTVNFGYKVPGEYTVFLGNIPEGYDYEPIKTSANRARYTANLTQKKVNYEITVLYPDGTAYANKGVKLMNGETEAAKLTTDEHGKAVSVLLLANEYDIVVDIPAEYGYRPVKTPKNGSPVVVKLFDVIPIDFKDANKMSEEALGEWASDKSLNNELVTRVNASVDNYLYTADIKGNEEIFFIIEAQWSGNYSITARTDRNAEGEAIKDKDGFGIANYNLRFYGDHFDSARERTDLNISGETNGGNNMQRISMKAGETFVISVSSLDGNDYKAEFIIAYERTPQTVNAAGEGSYTLKFDKIDYAIIEFKPTVSGMYKISSSTADFDPMLVCYSAATNKPIPLKPNESNDLTDRFYGMTGNDDGGESNNFSFNEDVTASLVGNTYFYYIYLKGSHIGYPAEITVNVERTGDASVEKSVTKKTATVSENLTKQPEQPGKTFRFAPLDGSASVEERGGAYYITVDETEYELYAAITLELQSSYIDGKYKDGVGYSFSTIETMGDGNKPSAGGESSAPVSNGYLTVYEDLNTLDTTWNYTQFISAYSSYCNSVGTYKLNSELKLFLERYLNQRGYEISSYLELTVASGCYWLIGCGYYA